MTEHARDDLIRMVELPAAELEFRASEEDDGRVGTLFGYAARFNTPTRIDSWEGKFDETIMPGAFRDTLKKDGSKVKVLFNHGFDPSIGDKPLGKPARQEEDDQGLYVEVPLDDTSYNRDLVASLKSGALDGMSFRFSVVREDWDEEPEVPIRTLKQVRLYEYGPVTFPAYQATTAGVRARDAYQAWRTASQISTEQVDPDDADPGSSEPDTSPTLEPVEDRQDTQPTGAPVEDKEPALPVRQADPNVLARAQENLRTLENLLRNHIE